MQVCWGRVERRREWAIRGAPEHGGWACATRALRMRYTDGYRVGWREWVERRAPRLRLPAPSTTRVELLEPLCAALGAQHGHEGHQDCAEYLNWGVI